ncbi:MAG TPA: transglycosylase family protein [Acidimicrobiales bacterium]|nr:transglycosylase family protein [Acidimicrobiales bacterium]
MTRLFGLIAMMIVACARPDVAFDDPAPPPPVMAFVDDGPMTTFDLPGVDRVAERATERGRARRVGNAAPTSRTWRRLAACESGGDPNAVGAHGAYHGMFQFSVATWRSLGYSGNPRDASPALQLQAARRLQARDGWRAWPACSRRLGLR